MLFQTANLRKNDAITMDRREKKNGTFCQEKETHMIDNFFLLTLIYIIHISEPLGARGKAGIKSPINRWRHEYSHGRNSPRPWNGTNKATGELLKP